MNSIRRLLANICILLLAPWTLYFAYQYYLFNQAAAAHHTHFYNVFANLNAAMSSLGIINLWFVGFVILALSALLLRPER
jgi:hypothetical protein